MAARRNLGYTASGLIAGTVFLAFLLPMQAPIPISLGVGIGAFLGSILLLVPRRKEIKVNARVILPEAVRAVLAEGKAKVSTLHDMQKRIESPAIRSRIESICGRMEQIYRNFEKDPKDIHTAGQFLSYYTDTTIRIIERYIEFQAHKVSDREIQATLMKVETVLQQIDGAFEKQLARLLRDDALDLESEIKLLENTLQAEGLGGEPRHG